MISSATGTERVSPHRRLKATSKWIPPMSWFTSSNKWSKRQRWKIMQSFSRERSPKSVLKQGINVTKWRPYQALITSPKKNQRLIKTALASLRKCLTTRAISQEQLQPRRQRRKQQQLRAKTVSRRCLPNKKWRSARQRKHPKKECNLENLRVKRMHQFKKLKSIANRREQKKQSP